jgi:tetratricopeptide (TPR) repeat protein
MVLLSTMVTGALSGAAVTMHEGSTPLPIPAPSEDALIMQAVLSESAGDLDASRELYEKLFTLTGNKEYLIREAQDALSAKKDHTRSITNLTRWVTQHPTDHDKQLYLVLAALYIETGAPQEADEIVDAYLTKGEVDSLDLEEFGALKIQLGEYADALELLKKAYSQSPNEQNALQIAALYLLKLKQPEKAISILERHIENDPETSVGTYFKLIEMYAKAFKLDKVLTLYKKLYHKDPQKYFLQKIIEISLYQKDTEGLIRFLESTKGNNDILYSIYKDNGFFDKAIAKAQSIYQKTHKATWLAEEAILVYEKAQKSHQITPEILQKMSQLFEKSFAEGEKKGMYLNYYGYTLIEHDMDVDKGIGLVRRALGKDPNNVFYLDSLAWGLYKKGQCRKAYKLMLRVLKKEGLKEQPEIKDHLKAIKACKRQRK